MTDRRYTLSEITAAMGIALKSLYVVDEPRMLREFIDLTVGQLKALPFPPPDNIDKMFLSPND